MFSLFFFSSSSVDRISNVWLLGFGGTRQQRRKTTTSKKTLLCSPIVEQENFGLLFLSRNSRCFTLVIFHLLKTDFSHAIALEFHHRRTPESGNSDWRPVKPPNSRENLSKIKIENLDRRRKTHVAQPSFFLVQHHTQGKKT